MTTLADEIRAVAASIRAGEPEAAMRLNSIATRVQRVEFAYSEVVDDAAESAEIAERVAREAYRKTAV